MSQHLYTCISVFCYWQNAAKLTEQKVCCERKAGINAQLKCEARIHHTQFEYLNH